MEIRRQIRSDLLIGVVPLLSIVCEPKDESLNIHVTELNRVETRKNSRRDILRNSQNYLHSKYISEDNVTVFDGEQIRMQYSATNRVSAKEVRVVMAAAAPGRSQWTSGTLRSISSEAKAVVHISNTTDTTTSELAIHNKDTFTCIPVYRSIHI